ncbi:hypothetical protein WKT02_01715 [Erysipelotrichaceae bacterium HCN-30851]
MINKTNGSKMKQRKDHDHQAKIMLSNKQDVAIDKIPYYVMNYQKMNQDSIWQV